MERSTVLRIFTVLLLVSPVVLDSLALRIKTCTVLSVWHCCCFFAVEIVCLPLPQLNLYNKRKAWFEVERLSREGQELKRAQKEARDELKVAEASDLPLQVRTIIVSYFLVLLLLLFLVVLVLVLVLMLMLLLSVGGDVAVAVGVCVGNSIDVGGVVAGVCC